MLSSPSFWVNCSHVFENIGLYYGGPLYYKLIYGLKLKRCSPEDFNVDENELKNVYQDPKELHQVF